MPKKHAPTYTRTKPAYVHPSLESSRSSSSSTPAAPQTVNQRIQQLRREQAPRATPERRDEITQVVTHRTVPPGLRRILNMVEVDSPPPKPGIRTRAPRAGARPPPGPAAPSSWLQSSRHAPDHIRNLRKYRIGEGLGQDVFCALAKLHSDEFKRLPSSRSLVNQCLKAFAINWEELVEYEQHYLPSLPESLKESLLSYLSIYGADGCLDFRSFKVLFANDREINGATGSAAIRFLDLTGLLNTNYSLMDLGKSLSRSSQSAVVTGKLSEISLESPRQKNKAPLEVADSWEDVAEEVPISVSSSLSVPIFPNLTRLSLAHPGASASWADLLALSKNLGKITHLSLAYWPMPSTTPNAMTASMVSKHTRPVALGGSHFYSELDDDWHEAANILRRLSQNTYSLKWLDLEGCAWHKSLTWDESYTSHSNISRTVTHDEWRPSSSCPGPDWNGPWQQIEYLNLFQGWIPNDQNTLRAMPAGTVQLQLLSWLREHAEEDNCKPKLRDGAWNIVTDWVEKEKVARSVALDIHRLRKAGQGKWCVVGHGWELVVTPREKAS